MIGSTFFRFGWVCLAGAGSVLACSSSGAAPAEVEPPPSGAGNAGESTRGGGGGAPAESGGSVAGLGGSVAGLGGSVAGLGGSVAGLGGSVAGLGGSVAGTGGLGGVGGFSGSPATLPVDRTACIPGSGKRLYVSPTGSAQGDGEAFATAYDFETARGLAEPGDTLLLQPGRYVVPYVEGAKNTLVLSQAGDAEQRIRIIAEGGRAEFDFSFPEQAWVQDSVGFLVSGSYWSMCRVDVTRAGYQGVYVTGEHNTFENCTFHDNRNTGLEINKGGAYTTVVDCDSYRNYDPKKHGGMADGFGPKESQGPGNRFYGCRAWENSDDGYDAYESPETVVFESSFAFRNGIDVWGYDGFDGNGNGFKVGGAGEQANHHLTRCASFANRVKGFDQNNNTGGLTIFHSVAFDNETNFALSGTLHEGERHDLRNNVAFGGPNSIRNALEQSNSWNLSVTARPEDYKDLTMASARAPRAADGSLAAADFLQLQADSALVDAGVDVGLSFSGSAPDLGIFEAAPAEQK